MQTDALHGLQPTAVAIALLATLDALATRLQPTRFAACEITLRGAALDARLLKFLARVNAATLGKA